MKELLIVVDYQKDFVDGALGFPGAETLDGPIAAITVDARLTASYDPALHQKALDVLEGIHIAVVNR